MGVIATASLAIDASGGAEEERIAECHETAVGKRPERIQPAAHCRRVLERGPAHLLDATRRSAPDAQTRPFHRMETGHRPQRIGTVVRGRQRHLEHVAELLAFALQCARSDDAPSPG